MENKRQTGSELLKQHLGHVWRIGRVDAFRPKGHGFDSRSSHHVVTLGKSFTHSCLWRFGMKFRHSMCREHLWVIVDWKKHYRNSLNERMNEHLKRKKRRRRGQEVPYTNT